MQDESLRSTAETLLDILSLRATDDANQPGYEFLADGETVTASLSWSALLQRACAVSKVLRDHVGDGDRALLLFSPGLDFLVAFLGCLHAGVIAVPCAPPRRPLRRSLGRIQRIAELAEPSLVLSSGTPLSIAEELRSLVPALGDCRVIDSARLGAGSVSSRSYARRDGVAFLQFTSGSTSDPRGVMVTHANLLHNLAYIHRQVEHDRRSVSVSWLPTYHDMGLVDGMLEPLFGGFRSLSMPPHAFLQRPIRWLRAISRYRATHSGGPNFAYEYCAEKISASEVEGLDLSSWKFAHNGAEPVRLSTLETFARRFSPCAFLPEAFYLCYGLAEATVSVSGGRAASLRHRSVDAASLERGDARDVPPAADGMRMVPSCGTTENAFELAIVDPESHQVLEDRKVGEIWLAGPSVSPGYFRAPQATEEAFHATTVDGRGPFLRTGDLGFVVDKELYVAGRRKDLIILSGRNLYPHDIELSAERAHESLQVGSAAAFSVDDGERESLVVLVEVMLAAERMRSEGSPIALAVRRSIASDHGVDAGVVGIVARGSLLRTTSGKIRRYACKKAYLTGELRVLYTDPPQGAAHLARKSD